MPPSPLLFLLLAMLVPWGSGSQFKAARLQRWVSAGFRYLRSGLCHHRASLLPEAECRRLSKLGPGGVAVYVSDPRPGEKVQTVLPDSRPMDKVPSEARTGEKVQALLTDSKTVDKVLSDSRSGEKRLSPSSRTGEKGQAVLPDPRPGAKVPAPSLDARPRVVPSLSRTPVEAHKSRELLQNQTRVQGGVPVEVPLKLQPGPSPKVPMQLLQSSPAFHEAVLVLDPSPKASFGHRLLVFHIDFNVNQKKCEQKGGVYLGSYECMALALKNRCENLLKRRMNRSGQQSVKGRSRRGEPCTEVSCDLRLRREERLGGICEIHFLPLVIGTKDPKRQQRLHCVELRGFSPCPQPLPISSPSPSASRCELNKNTRRCHRQQLMSHKSCRMYQTCDHALLLSGGWQQQITYPHHVQNIVHVYRMLQRNGFRKENIKTFFAGGGQLPVNEEMEDVFPAMEKLMIRSHLSFLCRTLNCADSLVLYLNSPSRSDGSMLLWDANGNGIADPKERYSVAELLSDIDSCNARRVFLFVDQSYPTVLAKKLATSKKHRNVILISSAWGSEVTGSTRFSKSWGTLQPQQCLSEHFTQLGMWPAVSVPGVTDPSTSGILNVTLCGAPCDSVPALSEAELRKEYMGCQNLPTMLWYQTLRRQEDKRN